MHNNSKILWSALLACFWRVKALNVSGFARSLRFVWLAPLLLAAFVAVPASHAARMNEQLEAPLCESLKMCMDLLLRYGPDSFDYHVLAKEFTRYGQKGQNTLLNMTLSKKSEEAASALDILRLQDPDFSPSEIGALLAGWPKNNIEKRSQIFWKIGKVDNIKVDNIDARQVAVSPSIQSVIIQTLGSDQYEVSMASGRLLDQFASEGRLSPPSANDYVAIAAGLAKRPSPGLAALMSMYPAAQSRRHLVRALLSGDSETVISAYSGLYQQGRKEAFETLFQTLAHLQDDQMDQALALSALLRRRHSARKDGFYLAFAKDILDDEKMSDMARFVAFDALLAYTDAPGSTPLSRTPKLSDTVFVRNAARRAAQRNDLPHSYWTNLARQSDKVQTSLWPIFWQGKTPPDQKYVLVNSIPVRLTKALLPLWSEALGFVPDYRVQAKAVTRLKTLSKMDDAIDKRLIAHLNSISQSHPVWAVQKAGGGIDEKPTLQELRACKINKPFDLSYFVKQMPFFEKGLLLNKHNPAPVFTMEQAQIPALRLYLSSALPLAAGWLGGYDLKNDQGGLIYYTNRNRQAARLMDMPVLAILPDQPRPSGNYINTAWIVTRVDDAGAMDENNISTRSTAAQLYRLRPHGRGLTTEFVATLPGAPDVMGQDSNGTLHFIYEENSSKQKPLTILPSGKMISGCL